MSKFVDDGETVFDVVRREGSFHKIKRAAKHSDKKFILILEANANVSEDALDSLNKVLRSGSDDIGAFELCHHPQEQLKYYDPITGFTDYLTIGGVAIRRELVQKIKSSKNVPAHQMGVDLGWSIRSLGYKIKFLQDVYVKYHNQPNQLDDCLGDLYIRCKYGTFRSLLKGHLIVAKSILKRKTKQPIKLLGKYICQAPLRLKTRVSKYLWHPVDDFRVSFCEDYGTIEKYGHMNSPAKISSKVKVSILVRVFSGSKTLEDTLSTIRNQSYKNIEIIIVENGLARHKKMIETNFSDMKIKYVATNRKCDPGNVSNIALEMATGDYVIFIEDGDVFYTDHIESLVMNAKQNKKAIVYSEAIEIGTDYICHSEREHLSLKSLLLRPPLTSGVILLKRDIAKKIGGFKIGLGNISDWNFWVEIANRGYEFYYINHTTAAHCVRKPRMYLEYATEYCKCIKKRWNRSTKQKIQTIEEAVLKKKKIVATLYEFPDATFRYRAYNPSCAIQSKKRWVTTHFSRKEFSKIKDIIPKVDLLVVLRLEYSVELAGLINIAKRHHIPVAFDIDDRICHPSFLPPANNTVSDARGRAVLRKLALNYEKVARLVDGFIVTNDFLGHELEKTFHKPYRVIPNSINDEQIIISKYYSSIKDTNQKKYVIGYFSGSPSHNRDFLEAAPGIAKFMEEYPDVSIRIVGALGIPDYFHEFDLAGRVKYLPVTDYLRLQGHIASVDVNIAPLLIDEFTNSKSELKFFEAAIADVPTIASPTYTYSRAIQNGKTGFLCQPEQWYNCLKKLRDQKLRQKIASAAKEYCLKTYTLEAIESSVEKTYNYFIKLRANSEQNK